MRLIRIWLMAYRRNDGTIGYKPTCDISPREKKSKALQIDSMSVSNHFPRPLAGEAKVRVSHPDEPSHPDLTPSREKEKRRARDLQID
jgi:hypothetical protein